MRWQGGTGACVTSLAPHSLACVFRHTHVVTVGNIANADDIVRHTGM